MSTEDLIQDNFMLLEEETMKAAEEAAAHQRKLMQPIWNKRREMVKSIEGFWGQAIGNSPMLAIDNSENDLEALEHLTDFHVEYDNENPNYRKIVATFSKNDVFKNETLTKEFIIDPEEDGTVISKATIEYHEKKAPSKKRKADEDDDVFSMSFVEWFGDDDVRTGVLLSEDVFPNAVDYYQGPEEEIEDDDEEIELGSEESDDDEEVPQLKKQKK